MPPQGELAAQLQGAQSANSLQLFTMLVCLWYRTASLKVTPFPGWLSLTDWARWQHEGPAVSAWCRTTLTGGICSRARHQDGWGFIRPAVSSTSPSDQSCCPSCHKCPSLINIIHPKFVSATASEKSKLWQCTFLNLFFSKY